MSVVILDASGPSMAGVPLLTSQQGKPARSMTHPLHDPSGPGRKRRVKQGEPFDPEELSVRLTAHIAEQKQKSQLRREARAAKAALEAAAAQKNGVYRHVPKVAAAAFERTATPDTIRQVHMLGKPAVRAYLELLKLEHPVPGHPELSLQRTQALDQAALEREMLGNRNQFQWDRTLEHAAEADMERELFKPPVRTFNEFAHLRGNAARAASRPLSTGDVFSEAEDLQSATRTRAGPAQDGHDRHDWAQREDEAERRTKKEKAIPSLKKMQSSWVLMGRKDKSPKERDELGAGGRGHGSPPDSSRSGRVGFLARFKRHPS